MEMKKYILEGSVVYDSETHSLFYSERLDTQITMAIPASLCLLAMLQKKNKIVSLEEFLAFAWESRGVTVSPNTIYQNISILRKTLIKFKISSEFIKTVPKRGFVIIGNKFSEINTDEEDERIDFEEKKNPTQGLKLPFRESINKKNLSMFFSVVMIILICGATYFFKNQGVTGKEINIPPYIYPEFTKVNKKDECHLFRNKSLISDDFFMDFTTRNGIKCDEKTWIYIINYPPAPQAFVLNCSSDLFSIEIKNKILCSSVYYC